MAHNPPRVVVIDGTNSLYRAFFAIPHLRAPDGSPTNAAYGFLNMLRKVLREERADAVLVVFDARGKTFRHVLYPEYKAHRDAQPEDLSAQIPVVHELIEAHRIAIVSVPDFEADDVIASFVARVPAGTKVTIVSTDKDLMQLVSDDVCLVDGVKDRRYGPAEVEARFGVPPDKILDVRSLIGDPSDNIPGVKGIGEKGAAKLIQTWGDLENLIAHRDEVEPKRARTALTDQVEAAQLSKRLATLRTDVPLPLDFDALARVEPDRERLRELYERLGFTRLLEELDAEEGGAGSATPATPIEVDVISDARGLAALVSELGQLPLIALCDVVDPGGPLVHPTVGLAFALGDTRAAYLVFPQPKDELDFGPTEAGRGEGAVAGPTIQEVVAALEPVIGAPGNVAWIGNDTKRTQRVFAEQGVELSLPHFDGRIAAHLLDPSGAQGVEALAHQSLGAKLRSWEDLAGRGAKATAASELSLEEVSAWAAEQVCVLRALHAPLVERLAADGLSRVFEEAELPLTAVLARMERTGVRIDEAVLANLSVEYEKLLSQIEAKIYELAGEKFLVSSPKQLQKILFDKLKLPVIKRTKTGYSTDEDVLEQLSSQHELPERILAYRRLAKLKNTYVDALPRLVHPSTGRIHPTFNQLGAATGRLSATQPNVQNIPIRTEEGIRIREAFVPAEGRLLLSADYSQVELRILAHYSEDESLIEAFRDGEDVHRRTAAAIAGIEPAEVSADQRDRAKAVNFGIIYGSSAFGLAKQLGIATADAQQTIDAYFERYAGVRRFLDSSVADARERGFVTTYLGRRRYLPDLNSRNRVLRQAAERMAVNSIIQGTAADLIKLAMVAVDRGLREEGLAARMILQVHDELVFEVPESETGPLGDLLRARMEPVLPLRVPLRVDIGTGKNWREAH